MEITFFSKNDLKNEESLKTAYKRLAKQYHSDCGGNSEEMKVINAELEWLLGNKPWKREKLVVKRENEAGKRKELEHFTNEHGQ